jgi:hypothetical protein
VLTDNHLVKFVKVKKPLVELIPGDPVIEAFQRLTQLRDLVAHVEHAGHKYSKTHPIGMVTEEDDNFRIRILRQSEMLGEVRAGSKTVKWGRYLRAPQVYFDVVSKASGRWRTLGDAARVKRGCRTSLNEFFYMSSASATEKGIAAEYLQPLLKSPKDSEHIRISSDECDMRVFICADTKEQILAKGHSATLKYIEWGEQKTYAAGPYKDLPWTKSPEISRRKPGWWSLPKGQIEEAQVFFATAFGERHIHRFSDRTLVPDKRLYFLEPAEGLSVEQLAALLNSSVVALLVEGTGRVTMGDGALELTVEDARDYLPFPERQSLIGRHMEAVATSFVSLLARPIGPIPEEIKKTDRHELDAAVLKAIGLDPKKYLILIYDGLSELLHERIELGRMRSRARKTKSRGLKAEKKAAEEVLDEVLPDGPKRFPEEFLSGAAKTATKAHVELPEAPLIFDNSPLFAGVHTADNSFSLSVKSPAEGKFLVYAHGCGHRIAELPEKVVEISRTVANYEQYLRDLRKQFYDAYFRRTLDTRTAARLTQAAFDRFRLPNLEG